MSRRAIAVSSRPSGRRRPAVRELRRATRRFYRHVLGSLVAQGQPFLVGGGYALEHYTGIRRPVRDLDIFVRPRDLERTMSVLTACGYRTELPYPHWLAKARRGRDYVDIIFSSGNGIAVVDDEWFVHAVPAEMLGVPLVLCPPEESIWSKAFVMERERYDGADVAHLIAACGGTLHWGRLLRRFGEHWRVLLAHLILFGYIYPGQRDRVPELVLRHCLAMLERETESEAPPSRICRGTLLSRAQYLVDVTRLDYQDARLLPHGTMSEAERSIWSAGIVDAVTATADPRAETSATTPSAPNGAVRHRPRG